MNINTRRKLGWAGLIFLALIPVISWFFLGGGIEEFSESITHSFGEIFGLVGMTLFALTFVLSTRISFIEDIFGGLDKVYIAHGILGGTALILILFHPIFLVLKFIPTNLGLAADYLLPSNYWSVNFGIISLMGLIILLSITLFTKLRYNYWKFSHEFLGLMFIIASLHIFLVRGEVSKDNIFQGYYIYASIVTAIGLLAFSYSLFIKNRLLKNAVYTVEEATSKNNSVELTLSPEHKPIFYKPGQFVFLRFYNKTLSKEQHPFSIASNPNSLKLKIIIKKLGDYTSGVDGIKKGDRVLVEGPYGRFGQYISPNKDQVWIAAGIGITPFLSLTSSLDKNPGRKVDLYYITKGDFVAEETLSKIQLENFSFIKWNSKLNGQFNISNITLLDNNKEFLICGPPRFMESIKDQLIESGVPLKNIYYEDFTLR